MVLAFRYKQYTCGGWIGLGDLAPFSTTEIARAPHAACLQQISGKRATDLLSPCLSLSHALSLIHTAINPFTLSHPFHSFSSKLQLSITVVVVVAVVKTQCFALKIIRSAAGDSIRLVWVCVDKSIPCVLLGGVGVLANLWPTGWMEHKQGHVCKT